MAAPQADVLLYAGEKPQEFAFRPNLKTLKVLERRLAPKRNPEALPRSTLTTTPPAFRFNCNFTDHAKEPNSRDFLERPAGSGRSIMKMLVALNCGDTTSSKRLINPAGKPGQRDFDGHPGTTSIGYLGAYFMCLVLVALGVTWILDGIEVKIVGAIGPVLQNQQTLGLSSTQIGGAASAYVIGAVLGAVIFGWLTDRFGRRMVSYVTLIGSFYGNVMELCRFRSFPRPPGVRRQARPDTPVVA